MMRYYFEKSITLLLAGCLTLAGLPFSRASADTASTIVGLVLEDEFDGSSQWTLASGFAADYQPTLTYEADADGTDYLRVSVDTLTNQTDGSPYVYRSINGASGIPFEADKRIVIQARIRVDNRGPYTQGGSVPSGLSEAAAAEPNDKADKRVHFKYNMPQSLSDLSTLKVGSGTAYGGNGVGHLGILELQYGFPRIATGTTGSQWQNIYKNNATSGTNYVSRAGYWSNEWFNYEIVMDGSNNKISIYCSDESEYQPPGTALDRTLIFPSQEKSLKNLVFGFNGGPLNIGYPCVLDVDHVKVYNVPTKISAELLYDNTNAVFEKADSFDVKFSAPVDEATIMQAGAVKLKNTVSMVEIASSLNYDEDSCMLTVTPDEPLLSGSYEIILDDSMIKALAYSDKFTSNCSFHAMPFTYYAETIPKAENLFISGLVQIGETITAQYIYAGDTDEGDSEYVWLNSADRNSGFTAIPGADEKSFAIPNSMDGYIKFGVKPISDSGLEGCWTYSDPVSLPAAPTASDVRISGVTAVGQMLYAGYAFSDINDDSEGGTKMEWLYGDSDSGLFFAIPQATGRNLALTEEHKGKYIKIKVTPVSLNVPYEGITYTSDAAGPVAGSLYENTNILQNPGFETGELSPWAARQNGTVEIASVARSGNYSLLVTGRKENADGYMQSVTLAKDKTYIISGYAMLPDSITTTTVSNATVYTWGSANIRRPYYDNEYGTVKKGAWSRVSGTIESTAAHTNTVGITDWSRVQCYYDDLYMGELIITDIDCDVPGSIKIPADGNTTVALWGEPVNQIGTNTGLYNQTVKWEMVSGCDGVSLSENNLTVSERAVMGRITLKAECVPTYLGSTASDAFVKYYVVDITSDASTLPRVFDANLSGVVYEGSKLTVSYAYYQVNNKRGTVDIAWLYSNDVNGSYREIPGATAAEYVVPPEYANGFFKVRLTPRTNDGVTGNKVVTDYAAPLLPPEASGVRIEGQSYVGFKLNGVYTYSDGNRDEEGQSRFRWLVSDTASGEYRPIAGANGKAYTLTENDKGRFLKFEVIPVSQNEPYEGTSAQSAVFGGPVVPEARDVSIKKSGNMLTGSYAFYHKHGITEGDSEYRWYVDGRVVSTKLIYNASNGESVTFEVTPVASKPPYNGAAVKVSTKVGSSGDSSGGSSSGGNSLKGGVINGGVSEILLDMQSKAAEAKLTESMKDCIDIAGHWGEEEVRFILSKGIMLADSNGCFYPDEFVKRADVIVYMAKSAGLEQTPYQGIFEDVSDGEFARYLQTLVDSGVISRDTHFNPDRFVTREEMSKITTLILDQKLDEDAAATPVFDDSGDIGEWAVPYVVKAVRNNIMLGVGDNRFDPKGNITNTQIAILCKRIMAI